MKFIPLLILPRAVQGPHQSWAALHSRSFLAPLDAHKLQHWPELLDETQLELNPRIVLCQSILPFPLHLPSFPSQPFSTSVNLILASKCFASTRYPKLFDKYALAGHFLLPPLLQENLVL